MADFPTHMNKDEEHLRLLSVFHYVVGGLTALFALIPIIHLVLGLFFILAPEKFGPNPAQQPPAFIGWLFVIFATFAIALGLILASLIVTTGRFLGRRRHHTFCLVIAFIECLMMPFGTVLGVFTIIVLLRDSVKQLFALGAQAMPPPAPPR
jgi:hypothetical protein